MSNFKFIVHLPPIQPPKKQVTRDVACGESAELQCLQLTFPPTASTHSNLAVIFLETARQMYKYTENIEVGLKRWH